MNRDILEKMSLVDLVDYAYDRMDIQALAKITMDDSTTEKQKHEQVLALLKQSGE